MLTIFRVYSGQSSASVIQKQGRRFDPAFVDQFGASHGCGNNADRVQRGIAAYSKLHLGNARLGGVAAYLE